MQTEQEYAAREAAEFRRQLAEVEHATLADKREARDEWVRAMRETPQIVAERVSWLIDGCYGKGAYDVARVVLGRPRSNRVAWFGQTIAALEWGCPMVWAMRAWSKLSETEQAAVNGAILAVIRQAEAE